MAIFDDAPLNLISDFTGADENPLSEGGNWANPNSAGSPLQRVSNTARGTAVAGTISASYWTSANFGPDLEAYVTVTPGAGIFVGILARLQGEGGSATWDGYAVLGSTTATVIRQYTNVAFTNISSNAVTQLPAAGDKLGMRIEGTRIEAWRQPSGSSDWNFVTAANDATYPNAGKIGLAAFATTAQLDDFYAGTINAVPVA